MKKTAIIYTLLLLCNFTSFAQFGQYFLQTPNQQLIESAIENGILLIRQEYQLEDTLTHKRYTLDHRTYFGSAVSFAVRTETGYVTRRDIIAPWENDPEYKPYTGSTYHPVLSKTFVRTIKDTSWREMPLIAPVASAPLKDSAWVDVTDTLYTGGIATDCIVDKPEGWMVWLTGNNEKLDSASLSLVIYRKAVDLSDGNETEITYPNNGDNVIGGIFIYPKFDKIGQIVFNMCGVAIKRSERWVLMPDLSSENENSNTDVNTVSVLTPIDVNDTSGTVDDKTGSTDKGSGMSKQKPNKKAKRNE
ncbi:MAG: hypothetical protein NC308_00845 [Clostridium sp.]|nr:hypothetical protein [Bacteroides sp.]MCM1197411.1 hypothetical protein [Clostridium sp.]